MRGRPRTLLWALILVASLLAAPLATTNALGYTPVPETAPITPDPWIQGNVTTNAHKST
jgi:drug/metabolite transporter (DMT)-like permease